MKVLNTYLVLLLILISFESFSQKKITVAVNEFSSNKKTKYIPTITNRVIETMYLSNNFNVLDRTELEKVKKEQYTQAGEEFIDSEITVEQGKLLKAKYLLNGNVEVISIMKKRNGSGSLLGYYCVIAFTIKITDVETGMLKSTQFFQCKRAKGMSLRTSILASMATIEKKLIKYFKKQLI